MLTMNVRHDCGCVKKGFSCWIFAPKKSSGSKNTSPEDQPGTDAFTWQLATCGITPRKRAFLP